jgi:hypothetical protein
MPRSFFIRAAVLLLVAAAVVASAVAWRSERHARAALAKQLAADDQALATAAASQKQRDAKLQDTLAQLDALQRAVRTPEQVVRYLPAQLPLPAPIRLADSDAIGSQGSPCVTSAAAQANSGDPVATTSPLSAIRAPAKDGTRAEVAETPTPPLAVLPQEDLKPLYDFAVHCHACEAQLAASQADLTDERSKTAIAERERDNALRVARGGSAWRRALRAAKWFAIGAAAGAIAAQASR